MILTKRSYLFFGGYSLMELYFLAHDLHYRWVEKDIFFYYNFFLNSKEVLLKVSISINLVSIKAEENNEAGID